MIFKFTPEGWQAEDGTPPVKTRMFDKNLTREDFIPKDGEPAWGLYDTKESVWLGDEKGPLLYNEELMASISAQIYDVRLKYELGRLKATPFTERNLRIRDKADPKMSGEDAVRLFEEGLV